MEYRDLGVERRMYREWRCLETGQTCQQLVYILSTGGALYYTEYSCEVKISKQSLFGVCWEEFEREEGRVFRLGPSQSRYKTATVGRARFR